MLEKQYSISRYMLWYANGCNRIPRNELNIMNATSSEFGPSKSQLG